MKFLIKFKFPPNKIETHYEFNGLMLKNMLNNDEENDSYETYFIHFLSQKHAISEQMRRCRSVIG